MRMGGRSPKIIVDTNMWISFLIGKNLKGLQKIFAGIQRIII